MALAAAGTVSLAEADLEPPVTIVLGAERSGLTDELLDEADLVASIPMPGDAESLNVAAAGAIFRVPLVPWVERPGRQVALAAGGTASLAEADLVPPVTIVLGAERSGLTDELLQEADLVASIPMPGEAESLNVAAAGAIALYELSRRS